MVSRTHSLPFDPALGIAGLGLHPRYDTDDRSQIAQVFQAITACEAADENAAPHLQRSLTSARLLSELEAHPACIVVALLRAVIPETRDTLIHQLKLDDEIQLLTQELSQLDRVILSQENRDQGTDHERLEDLRRLLLSLVQDIRVVIIALSERVWRMRNLMDDDHATQQRLAHHTLDLYTPLANRLGVWFLKWELEDLSLRVLEPEVYQSIARQLDERFIQREQYVAHFIETLQQLLDEHGMAAQVSGRPKHIFSIIKKMRAKNLTFDRVHDIRATRVIVDSIPACYTVLGLVHQQWIPVAGEFDDYIARPKGNQYRSLHTAVYGPDDKIVEVQIRTHEMHRDSELGIASHWRYKEGARSDRSFEERVVWLRQMLDWQKEAASNTGAPRPPADSTIFVFTPQSRIIDLTQGATAVDFAYHVHSELGHRCRGAKADGQMIPLNQPLKNGQCIEIITVRQGGPSRDWLNPDYGYLKTHRAQTKVRQWFKQQHWEESLSQGRAILDRWLTRSPKPAPALDSLAQHCGYSRHEDFLVALARNDITPRHLDSLIHPPSPSTDSINIPLTPISQPHSDKGILVVGVPHITTVMAKCCKPVPPEPILGFVTRGRGISIHRANCRSLAALTSQQWQRLIPVSWGEETAPRSFTADIGIQAQDRQGLLRDVTDTFMREKVNVIAVNTQSHGHLARMRFTIQIDGLEQLARTLRALQDISGVESAYRQ